MKVREKLLKVQSELKCNKSQYNSFGKYRYRNAEDILESAKPILDKVGAIVLLTDEVKQIGERYYIESTAIFVDVESGEEISVKSSAREEETKKGMDGSQITGASSSYARKYALNGLFAIDDTKDSDSTNNGDTKKDSESTQIPFEDLEKPLIEQAKEYKILRQDGSEVLLSSLSDEQLQKVVELYKDTDKRHILAKELLKERIKNADTE